MAVGIADSISRPPALRADGSWSVGGKESKFLLPGSWKVVLERLRSDRLPRSSWHRGLAGGLEGMICLPSSFAPALRERWQLQALPREMPCITNCCRFQAVRKGIPLLAAPTHCRVSVIALAFVAQGEREQRLLAQNTTRAWVKKDQNQRGVFSRPVGATNARDEFPTRVAEPLGL